MWFMSTPCSLLPELSEHCQLHPSQEHTLLMAYTWLFWQQALPRAAVGQWHWGAVGACSQHCAWSCVCVRAMAAPAASPHTLQRPHVHRSAHVQPAHPWLLCLWAAES